MPAADVVLLPLCIGLTLLGLIATAVAWRRGKRARVAQGVGWALVPVALYLTGLLTLLWNGVIAVVGWASRLVFSPTVWAGLSLLAVAVVLIGTGGLLARRGSAARLPASGKSAKAVESAPRTPSKTAPANTAPGKPSRTGGKRSEPVDEDMAEIEAILKNRGIN